MGGEPLREQRQGKVEKHHVHAPRAPRRFEQFARPRRRRRAAPERDHLRSFAERCGKRIRLRRAKPLLARIAKRIAHRRRAEDLPRSVIEVDKPSAERLRGSRAKRRLARRPETHENEMPVHRHGAVGLSVRSAVGVESRNRDLCEKTHTRPRRGRVWG